MTAAQQRKAQRVVHLAAALLLIAYLYAPLAAQLQDAVRFLALPALVVTGIAMWQAPRMRRLRNRLGGTRARPDGVRASRQTGRGKVAST
jgi:thiosulfate reductase cytochrome b subunit